MWDTKFVLDLVDVVYLASVLGNRPRPIDRHIDYFGEKITVFKDSVDGDQATVRTRIVTAQGTEIPVDYRMLRRGDRWMAYDVAIEGVSLVANYRMQFNRIIQSSSYRALVEKLKAKGG